ncbi:MAG TPA: hypothetical protein VM370_08155 [Candidatus Thermoplasmatota archaeon]|nr:hypothetical protein [Candidatus Thermoplasmatota archaeon]
MNPKTVLAFVALVAIAFACAPTAAAHKTAYSPDGKLKIVWGFLNEPAVTDTKNGLDLRIQDNATGYAIPDLQSHLHAEMHYGDQETEMDLEGQFGKPGYYTAVLTPTKAGVYVLHLSGEVNGTELDMEIPGAHEVEDIADTYFPAEEDDDKALEDRVAALETEVAALKAQIKTQTQTPATLTPQPTATGSGPIPAVGVVLAALAVVGVALLVRRKA